MQNFDLEIEESILGECIRSKENLIKVMDIGVTAEDFYSSKSQKVYEGLVSAFGKHNEIDLFLASRELKGSILPSYLTSILDGSIPMTNIKPHVDKLIDLSIRRQYEKLGREIQLSEINDIGDFIQEQLQRIEKSKGKLNNLNTITTLDKVKPIDVYKAEKVKTGFVDIDKRILGMLMGSLNIITGYNGNGKSTLINQMCIAQSLSQGYKVFAYSPELTNSNFKSWLYPTIADNDHFVDKQFGDFSYRAVGAIGTKAIDNWIKDKLYIYSDDSITNSGNQILKDMEKLAKYSCVRVFIIDNLMKVDLEDSYKNELIAQKNFVNNLKEFARKYNVLVHLVAHPRKPQANEESKITKFDIAGTGDITNLADYIVAVKRVSDKDREIDKAKKYLYGLKDCVVKIMKDRPKGTSEFVVNLSFDKERKRFYSYPTELNKEYGYVPKNDLIQVEIGR